MTGIDEYNKRIISSIDGFVAAHPKLKGYCNYIRTDKSLTSVYQYLVIIRAFLDYTKKEQNELSFDDFTGFMSITTKEDGSSVSSSWQIQKFHALKNYSTYLYDAGFIPKNYMLSIKRPKPIESQATIEKREKAYLNKTEIKQYISAIKTGVGSDRQKKFQEHTRVRDFAIIMVFLTTGIRRSALANLDVNSIDFENEILRVTDKGRKVHEYNLNETTLAAITDWLNEREEWLKGEDTEALFLGRSGERLQVWGIKDIVEKYAVEIKGKHISPHKLRATYGTQLYEATKDIYFVQHAMGHTTPTVTERYIRGQKNVTKKASDIMEKLI